MRTLLTIIFILLSTTAFAQTATINLAWDKNADAELISKYTLYEHVGLNYNKLSDILPSACNATTCTYTLTGVVAGTHHYVVTATNAWNVQSPYSNEVSTPGAATAPKNLIITITVTIQ